ncbi:MAG: tetratricopeptide repeat protein [Verrucomicrobia bacterium]|nr:tetratricopeptide repeat protein [Verrucomicrobiota bacterium]
MDPVLTQALQDAREGRLEAAISAVRFLCQRSPERPDAAQALGMLLLQAGRKQQALHHFQRAARLQPHHSIARVNLANALLENGQAAASVKEYRAALALDPDDRAAWEGLVMAQVSVGDEEGWRATARAGLERWPDAQDLAQIFAQSLHETNCIEEALDLLGPWVARRRHDALLHSTHAHLLNLRRRPREEVFAAHRAYGEALRARPRPPRREADPERPLRVGILSGDLCTHSVGFFAEAALARCPDDFTPVVFSTRRAPENDEMARAYRRRLPRWHEVGALSDAELDQLIRGEEIDVLLELSGHTWHQRLHALREQPAPVQVHAWGYCNTTGLPTMDWRVVDAVTDPPGAEAFSTERLLRLEPCFLCYTPPPDAPAPALPPAEAPITFGSFNNAVKLSPETVALWALILAAVPEARLLLKAEALRGAPARDRLLATFAAAGVAPERLELAGHTRTIAEHLGQYRRLHVALDPLPYNGTTTTCEALWMGVPVIALEGDRHAARVGASLLRTTGLESFLAADEDAYVRLAVELAQDRSRLAELRQTLRSTLAASPLLDAPGYAQRFWSALRGTWRDWCARQRASE